MNIDKPSERIVVPLPLADRVPGFSKESKRIDSTDRSQAHAHRRLSFLDYFPGTHKSTIRGHFVAFIGEFVGTFMFLFFAFSATQIANTTTNAADPSAGVSSSPNTSNLLFVALAFGFSLAVNAWVFFRISGGLFNPAVTLGMMMIGAVPWLRGLLIGISQLVGAIASAGVVSALFPGELGVRCSLGPTTGVVRGLFIEMFLTAELVFTIFMLAAEKHKATFIAPVGIGLALFIGELSGVYFTTGAMNPARAFGPAVVAASFNTYHWIYWIGPFLGSLVAVAFYKLVKGLEYETVNPGQDEDEVDHAQRAELGVADQAGTKSPTGPPVATDGPAGSRVMAEGRTPRSPTSRPRARSAGRRGSWV